MNEGLLSVKNASGRQVSLLNSNHEEKTTSLNDNWQQDSQQSKRKYHCIEQGCNKSFTTSGHLARHNRIHTGEKNFPCLFPGCQSRFSRQDNMMQHYKTHMSPKSRRSQNRGSVEEVRPRPRLHAHHRIRSDPIQTEPPLTIDQHLSNYHQSLIQPTESVERYTPVRFNFPSLMASVSRSPIKKVNPVIIQKSSSPSTPSSPTLSQSSSTTSLPSIHQMMDDNIHSNYKNQQSVDTLNNQHLFYQHRPLTFTKPQHSHHFPYTLLHPHHKEKQDNVVQNQSSGNYLNDKEDPMEEDNQTSQSGGLLQLAHIVSTFG